MITRLGVDLEHELTAGGIVCSEMVTPQARALVGQMLGSYRVTGVLGEGGMGVVYLAEHAEIGRKAAIKLLRPELAEQQEIIERFFREARAANRIRHPSIVDVYDFVRFSAEGAYLVMEYLEGETLAALVARHGKLAAPLAARVIARVASPLAVAHQSGVVHRDLKPDNIFILPDPDHPDDFRIKLLDFGVAKLFEDSSRSNWETQPGLLLGTPYYMSPEQCHGAKTVDHRTDIYALGVIAYELLVGRVPFGGSGLGEIFAKHQTLPPLPPTETDPAIRPAVDRHVLRALAKAPDDRFQSVDAFAEALVEAAGDGGDAIRLPIVPRVPPTLTPPADALGATATPASGLENTRPASGAEQPPAALSFPKTIAAERAAAEATDAAADRRPSRRALYAVAIAIALALGGGGALAGYLATREHGPAIRPRADDPAIAELEHPAPPPPRREDAPVSTGQPRAQRDMVRVPAGPFLRGAVKGPGEETPQRQITLSAFWIDADEVTVARYRACVEAGGCSTTHLAGTELPGQVAYHPSAKCNYGRPGRKDHPVNCVDWKQAAAYCRWAKKRLPSEAEWEKAARSADGRRFPWGSEPVTCTRAVHEHGGDGCGRGTTETVGSRSPAGDSPYGARDMLGNVAEWTADRYAADAYQSGPSRDPHGPTQGSRRVVRGGSWIDPGSALRVTRRIGIPAGYRLEDVGFRCARSVPKRDGASK